MKKILKWVGIGFLAFVAVIMVYAFLGKQETHALDIKPVDLSQIADGDYKGVYNCYRWSNTVLVTIRDHKIIDIKSLKHPTGRDSIVRDLTAKIVTTQNTDVDSVSGATVDSKAFLMAVQNSLS